MHSLLHYTIAEESNLLQKKLHLLLTRPESVLARFRYFTHKVIFGTVTELLDSFAFRTPLKRDFEIIHGLKLVV